MASNPIEHLRGDELRDRLQGDLLNAILSDYCYPWEPSAPQAEAFFQDCEADFEIEDWSDEELAPRAAALFAQLDRCWSASASLPSRLLTQFGDHLPQDWLLAIAAQARDLATDKLNPLDRLIACVQPLLSEWSVDDLQVFARPLVYAMRGEPSVPPLAEAWERLSPVEQARRVLAIAQYALVELEDQP